MESPSNDFSSATAVLLGALASGVNGPTWLVLRVVFLLLGVCLTAMLALAFSSSDFVIAGHVILLVIIGAMLFVLLNGAMLNYPASPFYGLTVVGTWFLAQTGLVSVEQQMEEMGILQKDGITKKDKKS